MWILILEAALALGLLVFIVWWTMMPVKKREDRERLRQSSQTPDCGPHGSGVEDAAHEAAHQAAHQVAHQAAHQADQNPPQHTNPARRD